MRIVILLLTALFLTVTTSAFCVEPVNSTDRNNPFVKLLEAQCQKYYDAGKKGDLDAWLNTRTAEIASQIKNNPQVTPALLKKLSKGNADLREFKFVRVDTSGDTARIIHQKVTKDLIILEATMFHNEAGEWKMGDGSQNTYSGDLAKDFDGAFKAFLANPKLQLAAAKKMAGDKEDKVTFPDAPKDGTPVSFGFLSMVGSGSGLRAKIRVFNHGDKDITALKMTLNYLDDKGEKLEDFPWTQHGSPLAKKKSYADIEVGVFVPENTRKIAPTVISITFADSPPEDWDKLTITSNIMSKKHGLMYAQHLKDKAKKEYYTFADFRKYLDLGYMKDNKKTWTHQNERWVLKLVADKEVLTYWIFVKRTSFNSGNPLVLLDRMYADNKLVSDKETRQMLYSSLKDSLEQ